MLTKTRGTKSSLTWLNPKSTWLCAKDRWNKDRATIQPGQHRLCKWVGEKQVVKGLDRRGTTEADYRNISHAKRYYQTIPCTENHTRDLPWQVDDRALEAKPVHLCPWAGPVESTILPSEIPGAAWLPRMTFHEERKNRLRCNASHRSASSITGHDQSVCWYREKTKIICHPSRLKRLVDLGQSRKDLARCHDIQYSEQ